MRAFAALAAMVALVGLAGCLPGPHGVDATRIVAPKPGEWPSVGRTYDEQRFSPLDKINKSNVGQLGLAWYADLDTARGQEATPLMIDGKLYVSTAWSMVKAFDGKTGRPLWSFDPKVARDTVAKACCDAVNRGVAAWGDKLFVGTLDGRLIALDRATGRPVWSVVTVDQTKPYTITGAPRAVAGKIIIGNGGAEFGVRGYISAYDADTGKLAWRFYTVPGDPSKPFEGEHLKAAARTWRGEWWTLGGGGTVWDAIAYDPKLDLLYFGVGNGTPWNQAIRSPAGGDSLYLSSIVAIRPSSGKYVWHYQTTPNNSWDFDSTQHIILADLTINGQPRKVLMQAPKNGFFYVLDRATGKLISADPFVPVNWATGVDPITGRPIENAQAQYGATKRPFVALPGAAGGHNWQPMAFDPKSGLVFIPANIAGFPYVAPSDWKPSKLGFNVGVDFAAAAMPADSKIRAGVMQATRGALIAWDPVARKPRWQVAYRGPWNGGLLATAGDVVFQGNAAGAFAAYAADTGAKLWSTPAQTGIVAAPISYEIDGEQYVAVMAGWGGVWALAPGILSDVSGPVRNVSRLLVYKLGGSGHLPAPQPIVNLPLDPPPNTAPVETAKAGGALFGRYCSACHGDAAISGALVPDLRHSGALNRADVWRRIVYNGALRQGGMISFNSVMSPADADSIRHYVIRRANEDKALEVSKDAKP